MPAVRAPSPGAAAHRWQGRISALPTNCTAHRRGAVWTASNVLTARPPHTRPRSFFAAAAQACCRCGGWRSSTRIGVFAFWYRRPQHPRRSVVRHTLLSNAFRFHGCTSCAPLPTTVILCGFSHSAAHYSALEAVSAIESMLRTGEAMYVHCWGGRGRSGLIAACLLGKVYGLQADEALERVSRAYQTREQGAWPCMYVGACLCHTWSTQNIRRQRLRSRCNSCAISLPNTPCNFVGQQSPVTVHCQGLMQP